MSNSILKPVYSNTIANETFSICDNESIRLRISNNTYETTAQIEIRWLPSPRLIIKCSLKSFPFKINSDKLLEYFIEFKENSVFIPVTALEKKILTTNEAHFTFAPKRPIVDSPHTPNLSRLVFHLPNFPYLHGQGRGKIILSAGGWMIQIQPVNNHEELIKELKKAGGFAITYVGEISKLDNSSFSSTEVLELMNALDYFFSFSRGFWTPAILPVGYDKYDKIIWQQWGVKHIDSWQYVLSWFDEFEKGTLPNIFPEFLRKWNIAEWQLILRSSIYWYLLSNTQGGKTDGSVVLIQTGLENFSWSFYMTIKKNISKTSFKKLGAAGQIEKLLIDANIPTTVPDELSYLKNVAIKQNWNGPTTFTGIRNAIVHPDNSNRDTLSSSRPITEGWLLGNWYIELILLYHLSYNGKYANRMILSRFSGVTKEVPWTISEKQ